MKRIPGRQYIPAAGEGHIFFTPEQVGRLRHARTERLKTPEEETAIQRVRIVYDFATDQEIEEGVRWYQTATDLCQELADSYSCVSSIEHAAGIVAALSPRTSWAENLRRAELLAHTGETFGTNLSVSNAKAILRGEHPKEVLFTPGGSNHKIRAFYLNMADKAQPNVTIDRHGWAILYDDREIGSVLLHPTARRYLWAEGVFQSVAEQVGLAPFELQAVTWVVWRKNDLASRIGALTARSIFD